LASFDFFEIFCIIYYDDTEDDSFRARQKLHTASAHQVSRAENTALSTQALKGIGINNNFDVLKGFPAVFALLLPAVTLPLYTAHAFQAFQAACRGRRRP
jgi:hypothetical protein